jgi:hypothetical protein
MRNFLKTNRLRVVKFCKILGCCVLNKLTKLKFNLWVEM